MIVYGVHPIAELLARAAAGEGARPPAATLLVARDNAAVRRLLRRAAALGIPVRRVTAAELARRCGSDAHRGVALVGAAVPARTAEHAPGSAGTAAKGGPRAPAERRGTEPPPLRAALFAMAQRPAARYVRLRCSRP